MARTAFAGPIGIGKGTTPAVTQITNRSTGVTINASSGRITMDATSLAAAAEATFVVTNSFVTANSVVVVCFSSGQTASTSLAFVSAVADGSFSITISNFNAATADTGAGIINFIVFNGATG